MTDFDLLTAPQRAALVAIVDAGRPVIKRDLGYPSDMDINSLFRHGLIRIAEGRPGSIVTAWEPTDKGRSYLKRQTK